MPLINQPGQFSRQPLFTAQEKLRNLGKYGTSTPLWLRQERRSEMLGESPTPQQGPQGQFSMSFFKSSPVRSTRPMDVGGMLNALYNQGSQEQSPGASSLFSQARRYYQTVSPFTFARTQSEEGDNDAGVWGNTYPTENPVMLQSLDANYVPGMAGQLAEGYTPWWRRQWFGY